MHTPSNSHSIAAGELGIYLRQIPTGPLLSSEQEQRLAKRFRDQRCIKSRDELVCANLQLVVFAAKRYRGIAGISIQDLIEAGNLGLILAVERFDPERGVRLATYAMWWIKKSMVQVIERQRGGTTTAGQPRIVQAGGEEADLHDMIEDRAVAAPSQIAEDSELQRRVQASLVHLDEPHAQIIRLRFGLDGESSRSIKEIGSELGVGTRQAAHMLNVALTQLRGVCAWAA